MLVHQSLNMQSFNGSQYFFNQHACRKADAYISTSTAMDLKDDIGSLLWRGESISQFHFIYPRGRGGTGLILQSASAAVANLSRPCSRHPPRRPIICMCECERERHTSFSWLTTLLWQHHHHIQTPYQKNTYLQQKYAASMVWCMLQSISLQTNSQHSSQCLSVVPEWATSRSIPVEWEKNSIGGKKTCLCCANMHAMWDVFLNQMSPSGSPTVHLSEVFSHLWRFPLSIRVGELTLWS